MHDKLVTQLIGQSSYYNVLEVDFLWAGEFPEAGWLADLGPSSRRANFDLKPFIPSMMDLVGIGQGTLYMIPMYNYSMGLIYRTDLLNDPKLQAAYKEQYKQGSGAAGDPRRLCRAGQVHEGARRGVAGAAMQGQRGDPNSMEFSNYLFSAGGHYLDKDGKVVLDSPEGVKALELYVDNIKNGGPAGCALGDPRRHVPADVRRQGLQHGDLLVDAAAGRRQGEVPERGRQGGAGRDARRARRERRLGLGHPEEREPEIQDAAWKFISLGAGREDRHRARAERATRRCAPTSSRQRAVLAKYPYYKDGARVVESGEAFPVFAYSAQYEDVLGTPALARRRRAGASLPTRSRRPPTASTSCSRKSQ